MMEVTKVWWDGNKIMAEPVDPASVYSDIVSDGGMDPRNKFDEPAQRTWEEWFKWWRTSKVADSTEAEIDFADFMLIVRAVESEYGIKEQK